MRYFYLIISFALLFSCKQNKNVKENITATTNATENSISTDKIFITMERSACYGKCPVYKITIYESGKANYEGIRFTEKEGKYTKTLNKTQLKEMKDQIEFIKLFEMKDKYDSNISDLPAVELFVIYKGKKKKIFDRDGAPNELKQFEKLIDYFVIDDQLKKVVTE